MLAKTRPAILQHIFGLALGLALGTMSAPTAFGFYADCIGSYGDFTTTFTYDAIEVIQQTKIKLSCSNIDGEGCCFFFRTSLLGPDDIVEYDEVDIKLACNTPYDTSPRTVGFISYPRVSGRWSGAAYYFTVDCLSKDKSVEDITTTGVFDLP